MTETYLPRAERRRRPAAHRTTASTASCSTAAGRSGPRSRRPTAGRAPSTSPTSSCAAGPSRRRRCCSAPGCAATSAARSPCTRRSSWPPASPTRSTSADDVPVHQVKEFAPDLSFGGSASGPGLVALALSDSWDRFGPAIEDWRRLAVYYAAITSEGRGARARRARPARPARHVPPDPARPGPARPGPGPPRPAAARGRGHRRLPVVPRRAGRAPPRRPGDDAGDVRASAGPA